MLHARIARPDFLPHPDEPEWKLQKAVAPFKFLPAAVLFFLVGIGKIERMMIREKLNPQR